MDYVSDIHFQNEGVRYTERKTDFHVFIAVIKDKDGTGVLAPIMAPDAFSAGIIAGTRGKLLVIMSLQDFLLALKSEINAV